MELRILLAHPRMSPPPMSIPARRSTRILASRRCHTPRRADNEQRHVVWLTAVAATAGVDSRATRRRCQSPRDAPRESSRHADLILRDATPSTPRDAGLNFRAFLFNFNSNPHAARRTTPRRVTDSTLSKRVADVDLKPTFASKKKPYFGCF